MALIMSLVDQLLSDPERGTGHAETPFEAQRAQG
jgi:hypothetical protein